MAAVVYPPGCVRADILVQDVDAPPARLPRSAKSAANEARAASITGSRRAAAYYPGQHIPTNASGRRRTATATGAGKAAAAAPPGRTAKRRRNPTATGPGKAAAAPPLRAVKRRAPRKGAEAAMSMAALAHTAQQHIRPGNAAVAGRSWSDEAWRAIMTAVHHVLSEAARRGSGVGDAAAHADALVVEVLRALNTATSVICQLATAFCCATKPDERSMALWDDFLASNVGPRLAALGLWPVPLDLPPDRHSGILAAPGGPIIPWIASMREARHTMLMAGMGESHGLPPGLGSLKQPWRYSTDLDAVTLPPPLDRSLLPAGPHGLCGFVPCMACTDVAMRQSLRFFARVELDAHDVYRVDIYSTAPMHIMFSGAPLPAVNIAGQAPGSSPLCRAGNDFWRWDGVPSSSPALRVRTMQQRFSTDPSLPARPVYIVSQADGRDIQPVVRVPFFFDFPVNGAAVRVVHEILLCNCCGSVQLLTTQLRHAARLEDSTAGDLEGYFEALLQSYRHCQHTLRVQAQLLEEDHLLKTELDVVRCIARRSPCCTATTCDRSHTSIFTLPLRLAVPGEVEIAASYALLGASVGEIFTLVCRDAADGCAILAPVHHKPGQVRCQNSHDCSGGIQCVHEANFAEYAAASGFSFLDLKRTPDALFGQIAGGGGAAPGNVAPPPAAPVQASSTTLIAPKLHDDVMAGLKHLEVSLCRWTTGCRDPVKGPFFELLAGIVHLWDIRCSVAGCEELLTVDRGCAMSCVLQTRLVTYFCILLLRLLLEPSIHILTWRSCGAFPAVHYLGACSQHGQIKYDGIGNGFLNFNNREIVALNILMQAEDMLITSRSSLQSAHRSHVKRVLDGAEVTGPPSMGPDLFRRVFWAYLLQRSKWEDAQEKITPNFCCASCGPTPRVVILDGIVMCTFIVGLLLLCVFAAFPFMKHVLCFQKAPLILPLSPAYSR